MEPEFVPIDRDAAFPFACGPEVSCFNQCCRDLNQILYPYDILRLCRHLEWPSDRFLEQYTWTHDGPRTGLPVVGLRFDPARNLACPFVTAEGCRVYTDRPAACRLYPLARAVSRSDLDGGIKEHFALLREPHCQGHGAAVRQKVSEWIESQGLDDYHRMNDPMITLIRLRRRCPGALSSGVRRRVRTALYDLDGFRRHLLAGPKDDPLTPSAAERAQLAEDDDALVRFAFQWVKSLICAAAEREAP